jgi:FkbM family methyltransferase
MDVPYRAARHVILDIGANVVSFAAWALKRWPGCHVHCYEPLTDNFALLKRNLGHVEGGSVSFANFAIGDCGEASFYDIGEQSKDSVEVETRAPRVLPKAQIMKIDAPEIDILGRLTSFEFDVIMLESRSEANRRKVDELLQDFLLVAGEFRGLHCGTLKLMHRRLVKAAGIRT